MRQHDLHCVVFTAPVLLPNNWCTMSMNTIIRNKA